MCSSNKLHTALRDCSCRLCFSFRADLVDNDDLGHVIFNGLDHHGVLQIRPRNLHSPARTNARVCDIAVTTNFVGCIDDNDALHQLGGQDTGTFSQQCSLSDTGAAEQQETFSGFHNIAKDVDCAEHGAAHTASKSNDDVAS